jgi:thiamine-phosphate pyrophosphorylase
MKKKHLQGLYAITDSTLISEEKFGDVVEQAIQGGARIIQYRDKSHDFVKRLAQAQILRNLCQQYAIPLIINDDIELAQRVNAEGVHLGKEDGDIDSARAVLGDSAIIGISCYNQWILAEKAEKNGADYIAFGRFFSSSTKPLAVQADIHLLIQAKQRFTIPLVAIGGITVENGKKLIEAGADCLAVIHGLFGQSNVKFAAERFSALFE